jgi:PRTRC genetic system ThiF family protein
MKHTINSRLLQGQVRVALVGCGGTGSQVLTGLARLHTAMIALGHPGGLAVTAYDPDTVSKSNVGRQLFSPADVGHSKATLLVHRLNAFFGLNWMAKPFKFEEHTFNYTNYPHIVISCVDTKHARREIAKLCGNNSVHYWLDYGNEQQTGQVILGQPKARLDQRKRKDQVMDLPCVTDLYPQIMDANEPEDDTPSCSLAESLEKQDLFINQQVATSGLQLLWQLFRNGGLDNHGAFINLASGMVTPLPVDPEVWADRVPQIPLDTVGGLV